MDDVAVALEHVHLLNGLDGLDIELLERSLELLVITGGAGRRTLDLSPGSTLATIRHRYMLESSSSSLLLSSTEWKNSHLNIPCQGKVG